jgi:hypothetical protein
MSLFQGPIFKELSESLSKYKNACHEAKQETLMERWQNGPDFGAILALKGSSVDE